MNHNNNKKRQPKQPSTTKEGTEPRSPESTATRQKRTGQWRSRCANKKKVQSFKNSAAKDKTKSEPTHEDHMKVVNKENRFA